MLFRLILTVILTLLFITDSKAITIAPPSGGGGGALTSSSVDTSKLKYETGDTHTTGDCITIGTPTSNFKSAPCGGGFSSSDISGAATLTVNTEYHVTLTAPATLTLPTAPADGAGIRVIDVGGNFSTNNVTLQRGGTNTIEGATNKVLSTNFGYYSLSYHASTARWVVQEESGNIQLNAGNGAVSTLGADTIIDYTIVGTSSFTPPSGVNSVRRCIIGGGGGGGGGEDNAFGGAGGGAAGGQVTCGTVSVIPGVAIQTNVGAGGTGGTIGTADAATNGAAGGDSSFGSDVAVGGRPGKGDSNSGDSANGFNGGGGPGDTIIAGIGTNFSGGAGFGAGRSGGGGAGMTGAGLTPTSRVGGDGGPGFTSNILGADFIFGCGGGGGSNSQVGPQVGSAAGCPAGSKGSSASGTTGPGDGGTIPAPNQGHGGGGGSGTPGRAGSAGRVVIRYVTPPSSIKKIQVNGVELPPRDIVNITGTITGTDDSANGRSNIAIPSDVQGANITATGSQAALALTLTTGEETFFRFTGSAALDLQGVLATSATPQSSFTVCNTSTSNITVRHQSGSAAATDQIITNRNADMVFGNSQCFRIARDTVANIWRMVGAEQSNNAFGLVSDSASNIAIANNHNALLNVAGTDPITVVVDPVTRTQRTAINPATLTSAGSKSANDFQKLATQSLSSVTNTTVFNLSNGHRAILTMTEATTLAAPSGTFDGGVPVDIMVIGGTVDRVLSFNAAWKETDGVTAMAPVTIAANTTRNFSFQVRNTSLAVRIGGGGGGTVPPSSTTQAGTQSAADFTKTATTTLTSSSGTTTWNLSNGHRGVHTLTENTTLSFSGATANDRVSLLLIGPASGTFTFNFGTKVFQSGGVAMPPQAVLAGQTFYYEFGVDNNLDLIRDHATSVVSQFQSYRPYIINASAAASNYQHFITVDTASLISAGFLHSTGRDILISTSRDAVNSAGYLPHCIEEGSLNTTLTRIWFRHNFVAGDNTIYFHFNNPNAASIENCESVFAFYDAFDGTALNGAKWNTVDGTGISVSGGSLRATNNTGKVLSVPTFNLQLVQETQFVLTTDFNGGVTVSGFGVNGSDNYTHLAHATEDYVRLNNIWFNLADHSVPGTTVWQSRITSTGTHMNLVVRNATNNTESSVVGSFAKTLLPSPIWLVRRGDDVAQGNTGSVAINWVRVRAYSTATFTTTPGSFASSAYSTRDPGLVYGNGTISYSGGNTVLSYLLDGPSVFVPPVGVSTVRAFVVGGGAGAGGAHAGAGGGAGRVVEHASLAVSSTTVYNTNVGKGGDGAVGNVSDATNGGDSSITGPGITPLIAPGGGRGGGGSSDGTDPNPGGSGGGGSGNASGETGGAAVNGSGGSPTAAGLGFPGGNGSGNNGNYGAGAGGGGASGPGLNATGQGANVAAGGNGGPGIVSNITGVDVIYACGGGGGPWGTAPAGIGGCSSAGNGATGSGAGGNAAPNSGSGGGGSNATGSTRNGGRGGSGIIIFSWPTVPGGSGIRTLNGLSAETQTFTAGSGMTITSSGNNHTFASTGGSSSFTAAGNSGTNQTISSGDTLSILGGGMNTCVGSATDTITCTVPTLSSDVVTTPAGVATIQAGAVNLTSDVTGVLPDANVADNLTITGGTINNSVIGGTTPAAITGTTITATTAVKTTAACAAGFTASQSIPNFCEINDSDFLLWVDAVACTARTLPVTVPSTVRNVKIVIEWKALANNSTGFRSNNVTFFSTSACSAGARRKVSIYEVREQIATLAGAVIARQTTGDMDIILSGPNTFYTTQDNAGGNGNAEVESFRLLGYYQP